MAKGRHRLGRTREEVRDRKGDALHALGARRGPRHHRRPLRPEPPDGRAEGLAEPGRARRLHQPRGVADLKRLLRLRDPGGRQAGAAAPALRGDDPRPRRPRLDDGVERGRAARHLRMGGGLAVRHSPQRLAPALQRLRPAARALRRRHQPAARDEPLRGRGFHLQHAPRLQEPLRGRTGLFQQQGRAEGPAPRDELRRRRGQPAAHQRQGARELGAGTSASTWRRAR